jgi:hypothetical protein
MHRLHETETGHHHREKYRRPSLERRTIKLALEAHAGTVNKVYRLRTVNTVYPTSTRSAQPRRQKIAIFDTNGLPNPGFIHG